MSTFSGLLGGVADVQLTHHTEKGDGSYEKYTYLFVLALDPTGIQDKKDENFGHQLWGVKNQVGLAVFQFEGRTKLRARDVRILASYQRQGLGVRMYRYAQEVTGRRVLSSGDQTTAGKALWSHIRRSRALGHQ